MFISQFSQDAFFRGEGWIPVMGGLLDNIM